MQRKFDRRLIIDLSKDMNQNLANTSKFSSRPMVSYDNIKRLLMSNNLTKLENNMPIRYAKVNELNSYIIVIPVMDFSRQCFLKGVGGYNERYFNWEILLKKGEIYYDGFKEL